MEAQKQSPLQKELLGNPVAIELKRIAAANPPLGEMFVMDDKGALVGENSLTSDYWQGDEDKWKGAYAEGRGGVDVGPLKFDKSSRTTLRQISLPILDEDGTVIGAVTCGVDIGKL